MTRPAPPHDTFHLEHPRWKHEENSNRGDEEAKRTGKRWTDLDNQIDAEGVMWNTHWLCPLAHDNFRDPAGHLTVHTRIDQMTSAEVERLETKDGHPPFVIRHSIERVHHALELGLGVEFEAKTLLFDRHHFQALWDSLTPAQRERVQVKALPEFARALVSAHGVGFVTIVLSHGAAIPLALEPWIDFHRGPIRWTK